MSIPGNKIGVKLAPYNPTNNDAVQIAIDMLAIKEKDVIFDLGCGDGRFLIAACERNQTTTMQCIGIEYDRDLFTRACENVHAANLSDRISIFHSNVLDVNFVDSATVLFIYLVPEGILLLKEKLLASLEKGARIVTYVFSIPDVVPTKISVYKESTKLYLYCKK